MPDGATHTTVLCFSHDTTLLMTRQWMLERLGYTVLSVMGQAEFRMQICRTPVDLILLCQTLSVEECSEATRFAAEHAPAARCAVLRTTSSSKALPDGDVVLVDITKGPTDFLQTVTRMLRVNSSAAHPPAARAS